MLINEKFLHDFVDFFTGYLNIYFKACLFTTTDSTARLRIENTDEGTVK